MAISQQSPSLRIIFAGTPDFAAQHLNALLTSSHDVVGVLTQPDRPAGRGNKMTASPVKTLAEAHSIPVFQPNTLKSTAAQQDIDNLNADIMVVVAYGLILPEAVLALPRLGCINVHGSLLPQWRGAAPIQRACLAGDTETGVTIMQMDTGLDTGAMLHQVRCNITDQDTSASLYKKLGHLGSEALIHTLNGLSQGIIQAEKQDDNKATYAEKLSKQEARLDWQRPAVALNRAVRAFNPWPVSYFEIDGHPIKVWESHVIPEKHAHPSGTIVFADKTGIGIATSEGILVMTLLQPAGKKMMTAPDLLNSRRDWFRVGTRLEVE